MEKNPELRMAWEIIEKTGANLFLTGKAGTGKTTFLRELRKKSPKRMVVLAPTGIAAINAGGSTIHSFFQLSLSPYVPGASFAARENRRFKFSRMKRNIIRTLDLLVIDEVSMVRADLLDAVDSVMRQYREPGKPFGGVQLLLIGDLQQLAPVVKDDEWDLLRSYYASPFFFSSHALNLTHYQTVELVKVYRQQDGRFVELLNKIRDGKADATTLAELNRRYQPDFVPPDGEDYIRLTTHNHQAQAINERELERLSGQAVAYDAKVDGTFPEHAYPAESRLTLKVGAQVMFLKNAPDRSYYNGMIGRVAYVDRQTVRVECKEPNRTIELEPAEWTNSHYTLDESSKEITETVEGTFKQYPLRLAWAITIHKSQGLTFEKAIIDASHSFAHGQAYVALSRCKSLEGMVLNTPLRPDAIISDNAVGDFITKAEASQPTRETLLALQRDYVAQTLDELFGLNATKQAMEMVKRTLSEHFFNKCHTLLTEYTEAQRQLEQLTDVGNKFGLQYRRMLAEGATADTPALQERIHKGAAYFAAQLEPLRKLVAKTRVAAGNKLAKAQLDERREALAAELALRTGLLQHEADKDVTFSTSEYLHHKARLLLGESKPAAGQTAGTSRKAKNATAAPAAPKMKSAEVSHKMLTRGMTVTQIAKERGLAESTVFGHLMPYVVDGNLPLDQLVTQEHIDSISNLALLHPELSTTKQMKEALGDDYLYDEIRLVKDVLGLRTEQEDDDGQPM